MRTAEAFLVPVSGWGLAASLLPRPPVFQWHSVPPPHLPTSGRGLCFPCGPSLYPTSSSSPPFFTMSVYSHHLLFNCFPSLCSAQRPLSYTSRTRLPAGLGHARRLHHSCGQTVEASAWIWNLRQAGDFRPHGSAHSFTGLSVGSCDTGFCKSRAVYTLVVISTDIYLRYIA